MPIDCPGYEDRRSFIITDTPAEWDAEADSVTKSYNDWVKNQSCKNECIKSSLVYNRGAQRATYKDKEVWAGEVWVRVICHHRGFRLRIEEDDFPVSTPWQPLK